ncbi:AIG_G0036150.mRNA.1.CDS.1 [Saccharomyces cerevisiae]|nr:AIG_G0036150.mRNA.1.CDS.1 [Saccharomyces cerevisiae]CAI6801802.1 AIG_G0036150.mRNA.1.CDS.1 [Saccharomyces cerevisiae]
MGNSKTNGFFTPEKYLYGIIQGLPLTLRGLAFIFFFFGGVLFLSRFLGLVRSFERGARQRIPKTEIRRQ